MRVKCTNPASPIAPPQRYNVTCQARLTAPLPGADQTVVLTNPGGRIRFPNTADVTKTLTLPKTGAWVDFTISGESGSGALNDTVIEAHHNTAGGDLCGDEDLTVFHFDSAVINIAVGGVSYSLISVVGGKVFDVPGWPANLAVSYTAQARIRPGGVDCTSVPQTNNLRIGILQNLTSTVRTIYRDTPRIRWNRGVPAGTQVTVPLLWAETLKFPPGRYNDTNVANQPLYDIAGVVRPIGCGGGAATANDTPTHGGANELEIPGISTTGQIVGMVKYTNIRRITMADYFVTWCVTYQAAYPGMGSPPVCALQQRHWRLVIDSSLLNQKAIVDGGSTPPTMAPVTPPPFPNVLATLPANTTFGPGGPGTITFTK